MKILSIRQPILEERPPGISAALWLCLRADLGASWAAVCEVGAR